MTTLPPIVPALPPAIDRRRNLPLSAPFSWLRQGWSDLWHHPMPSLIYGIGVAGLSVLMLWAMLNFGWDQVLFPALSGLVILGPVFATGLYEKSRLRQEGREAGLGDMLRPKRGTVGHVFFVGAILCTLAMVWMRAAVIIFALFWGWRSIPGVVEVVEILFTTQMGWSLLGVGTAVGGLFAAFGFAISAFSIPLVLDRDLDAFTAMGLSMSFVWNNLGVMLVWGAIVLVSAIISVATGFVGLAILFPLLGHATWHAYRAVCGDEQ
ncbi:MAG TPA: DUF2189 domain-containing protein [Pelagibacterium sp.]|uniref:DUF2189 domain-containing protein n=1 Tax=Pelagibacterium sp. TaxID=1967288 RepID=UPI002BDF140C|nr:DUF2189 domain-containing protein [Pelagibacterium sp.]HWJ88258.1 DUF2189 domain-containing protein [Pelagibacterium sp.]